MAEVRRNPLPVPLEEYDNQNDAVTRRTIEFAFDQIETDIDAAKKRDDKTTSLSLRRFQFLLLGAS